MASSTTSTNGAKDTNSPPLTSFHIFPDLPSEIRHLIWQQAARDDVRILEVHFDPEFHFTFHSLPASLLLVNQEAEITTRAYYRQDRISFHRRQMAFFNFETDILYLTCYTYCPTHYACMVERFLKDFEFFGYAHRLRHLALSLPVLDVDHETTAANLKRRSLHSTKPSYGMASMMFFNKVQLIARRAANVPLSSLTLVFADPIVQHMPPCMVDSSHVPCGFDIPFWHCIPKIDSDVGVAKAFNAIAFPDQATTDFWMTRMDYCKWKLRMPHASRSAEPLGLYDPTETNAQDYHWGTQGLDIRMTTVDRVYIGTKTYIRMANVAAIILQQWSR
ncbi:hypothetical protein N431DRAFT_443894 [Stipitochalara longipes BDJ]|nr:hypothetical protein N431DRAFT_443894 [Stipitochalara longipes BDJ]